MGPEEEQTGGDVRRSRAHHCLSACVSQRCPAVSFTLKSPENVVTDRVPDACLGFNTHNREKMKRVNLKDKVNALLQKKN